MDQEFFEGYGFGYTLGVQTACILLGSLPSLVLLGKKADTRQLMRAMLVVAGLAFIFGIKDAQSLALCPLMVLAVLLTPEMTPFLTALALVCNMAVRVQTETPLTQWWYLVSQVTLILLGGAYERLVLSDYGLKEQDHGRSFWFWTGQSLGQSSFKKGQTNLAKLVRKWRNLLCQSSLAAVCFLDPALSLCTS